MIKWLCKSWNMWFSTCAIFLYTCIFTIWWFHDDAYSKHWVNMCRTQCRKRMMPRLCAPRVLVPHDHAQVFLCPNCIHIFIAVVCDVFVCYSLFKSSSWALLALGWNDDATSGRGWPFSIHSSGWLSGLQVLRHVSILDLVGRFL